MERFGNTPHELRLLELAHRPHGVIHDGQLTRRGLTRTAIDQRVGAGRLSRLHDGVFAWGHSALTREGRWLAALWACGEGAVLSHTTAAAFHGMAKEAGADVHVSTTKSIHSRPGIVVHRLRRLDSADVQRRGLLRATRIARTVVDLADVSPWEEVRRRRHASLVLTLRAASRSAGRLDASDGAS